MSLSANPVSSDLLKRISLLIENSSYSSNSYVFNSSLLTSYGPKSKQSFTKVPKCKKAHLREEVIVPKAKEGVCGKVPALEIITDLRNSRDIIENIINIFEVQLESDDSIAPDNFTLAKFGINSCFSRLQSLFCFSSPEDFCCQVNIGCEIKEDLKNLIICEAFKIKTVGKHDDIMEILKSSFSTFTKSRQFDLSEINIL